MQILFYLLVDSYPEYLIYALTEKLIMPFGTFNMFSRRVLI